MNEVYKQDTIHLYTLEDAEKIIDYRRARQYRRKKSIVMYYIKQKLSGLALVASSIITTFISDGDATASLILLPLGLYLFFTRSKIMDFRR